MIKVDINNRQEIIKLNNRILQLISKLAKKAAESEGCQEGELSIALVDNKEIRFLNSKYRQVNNVTDVLSFPIGDEILGDVVISVERAKTQADEYGHSFQRELCYLLIHGILHLCGYNHKSKSERKEMRKKEEDLLSEFNLVRE